MISLVLTAQFPFLVEFVQTRTLVWTRGEIEIFVLPILLFSTSVPEIVYIFVSQLKTDPDHKLDLHLQHKIPGETNLWTSDLFVKTKPMPPATIEQPLLPRPPDSPVVVSI
jgi:hypothetical protein